MTPDLDTDPVLLLGIAAVLGVVALVLWLRERRTPVLVVLLAQRREDGGADDGVLDEQPKGEQQDGDSEAEDERELDVFDWRHGVSVSGGRLRFDSPLTPADAAEMQRRWNERRHG
ncbi:hypothetical protein SAMN04515691_2995 [Leifsonia sp. 98AMF]|uniref:hypothetical protein n=1 Tax=unclassified Leifsonia TaxID=2663824 RepID=UPI00087B7C59|nr:MULTISPECIES: hypothetical protein [unclassified Leifsonia]SDH15911.1 hypothetical protein SAMN04515690_1021 [Leifsonia sp. 197AMF]SDJ22330.1 hypothetical protein SAMN04515684_2761 [Leifsonia sp. 466MF]SDK61362.1 hypothetical protein SAMN04515683_4003 [Leifsonia sp. 157MF]SDN44023.1 hypothetical protein SAMN04515686_0945 [Leifsonia sp. 509MF]SEN67025.1 hypothetical protein SAMN04515685_3984 [Leifsonia sp. 467MF]